MLSTAGNHAVNATRSFNNPASPSRRHDVTARIGWLPGPLKGLFGGKDEDGKKVKEEKQEGNGKEVKEEEEITEEPEGERMGLGESELEC